VQEVAGFLQGYTQVEGIPFFIVFAHTPGSFALDRYQLIEGQNLHSAGTGGSRGKPVMLGKAAAEALDKSVGDTLRITGATYRIVGIYETGTRWGQRRAHGSGRGKACWASRASSAYSTSG
jgi:hypothetical protein